MSGMVVFSGTRVPVQTLVDYLEEGDRLDDFLEDFPTVSHLIRFHGVLAPNARHRTPLSRTRRPQRD